MPEQKLTLICPVCGSSDLYYETGGYTGSAYHCKKCDYVGTLVIEADEEMTKVIREDYEKK
jgi:transposase-like protein